MKSLKILIVAFFVVFGFLGTIYLNDGTALAARARCYMVGGLAGSEVSCSNATIVAAFLAKGWTADDNTCYIFEGSSLRDSPCNQDPFTGPRCYLSSLGGSGIQSCSSAGFAEAFRANGTTPQPGHCYIFTGLVIEDVDCNFKAFGGTDTLPKPVSTTPPNPDPTFTNPYEEPDKDPKEIAEEVAEIGREGGFEETDPQCTADNAANCSVTDRLSDIANVLSLGVGIIIVIMIIVGGIQYTMAGGDAGKVAAAKGRITNAIYALIAFFFLYSFLQWVVPGGIF